MPQSDASESCGKQMGSFESPQELTQDPLIFQNVQNDRSLLWVVLER